MLSLGTLRRESETTRDGRCKCVTAAREGATWAPGSLPGLADSMVILVRLALKRWTMACQASASACCDTTVVTDCSAVPEASSQSA